MGGHFVGVSMLGVDDGAFWSQMQATIDFREDIVNGVIKSIVFGFVVTWIALFEGYDAIPTSEGVSRATTRTVVNSAFSILALDFILTALMFGEFNMQHSKTQDTLVGLFVACGIAALFYMALQISNLGTYTGNDSYTVSARFQNSGGLKVKSPVSVAGVRIGRVAAITLDKDSLESVVKCALKQNITISRTIPAPVFIPLAYWAKNMSASIPALACPAPI